MNEKKRLLKNTGLIAIGNLGAKMIAFILLPLYTSILTTEEYGVYDYIVAVSAFLLPVVTLSMHEALFRYIIDTGDKGEKFKKVVSNAFFITIIGVIFFALICTIIYLTVPKLNNIMYVFAYVVANALYTFFNNLLRGLGKIKEYSIISTGKNIIQLILNVLCVAVFRLGINGLLFSLCISEVIGVFIVVIISKFWKMLSINIISKAEIKPMLKYSIPLIPNNLGAQIINISDRLIISKFMGASANGIYSVSYKFPNIIETVYHFFYMAWSESASRIINNTKEKVNEYYQSLYDIINNFIFSIILLMTAGMPIIFKIFVKGNYASGFIYVPILLLAMYFDCIAKFYSGIYTALKKTKIMATSTVIAAIINVMVNIIFIKVWGLYAAAISTLIAEFLLMIIRKKCINKDINIKLNIKRIISETLIFIIIVIIYDYSNYIKLGISILIALSYSIVSNRNMIKTMIRKIKNKREGVEKK